MRARAERADKDRDLAAFTLAYERVRRYAAFVAPVELDPDDLVQEAVARALRAGNLDEVVALDAYLRRIVHNLIVAQHRRSGLFRRSAPLLVGDVADLPRYPSDLSILDAIGAEQRAAIFLVDLEGRSVRDAARICGCTESAMKKRLSRARHQLRREHRDEGGTAP